MQASALKISAVVEKILLLTAIAFFSVSTAFAQAQASTADLTGTVVDPNGAVVPGATVTVSNAATGITRTNTTNSEGLYQVFALPPGEYEVSAEAPTFKKSVIPSVRLTVGQRADLRIQLEVGSQDVVVTVPVDSVVLVETTTAAVSTTIDERRIDNLPINERSATGFALTISAVGRDNGRPIGPAPTSGLNIGGQRGRSTLIQVDGSDFTDNSINAARTTVSQEAVQEYQVAIHSYAPEFGRATGGIINVVTKRGTNQFSGNVFGFIRDKSIQARNPFSPVDKPDFRRTQFGGTIGGPIVRDKTFFFASFERRQRDESGFFTSDVSQGLNAAATIPLIPGLNPAARTFSNLTAAQAAFINSTVTQGVQLLGNQQTAQQGASLICAARAYAFFAASGSATALTGTNPLASPNDGSQCPAITPVTGTIGPRFLLSGAPVPVGTTNDAGLPIAFRPLLDLQKVFPITDRTNFFSIRGDHNFNDDNQLTVRFGYNPSTITGIQVESQNQSLGQNDFSRTGIQDLKDTSFTVGLNSILTQSIANEFRFHYGRRNTQFRSQNGDAVAFNISGTAFIGRELFSPVDRTETRYQFADNVNWVWKNHTFKFGGDVNWVDIPSAVFELNFAGLFNFGQFAAGNLNPAFGQLGAPDFTPVQSYGLGLPSTYIQGFGDPVSKIKNRPIAFFAQDTWRLTPKLTINYGIRYDFEFTETIAPVPFQDPLSGISLTAEDLRAAQDVLGVQQGIPRDKNNWAPRFGFAYDIFGNGRTVIRGAAGLFYDHPLLAIAFNSDIADAAQQQQAVLTPGSPASTALLNATQVFQGTVCVPGAAATPVCAAQPAGTFTPGVAPTAQYQFGRQRFNDQTFTGFGTVLPFTLPIAKDFQYAYATQANLAFEHQLTNDMAFSVSYLYVGARHLPHPTDLNTPNTALQIENFRRFAGRAPVTTTEAIGFSFPVAPPGSPAGGANCTIVIPGAVANCAFGRVVAPAFANFFRPNAPNYFLTQSILNLYNAQVPAALRLTLTDFNNALAGTVRTPGVISPFGSVNAQMSDANSNYNAMTAKLTRRFANNFTFLASYTWAHAIDQSSDLQTLLIPQDPRNLSLETSDSLFDQRHRFVFSGVMSSPEGWRNSDSLAKKILSDFIVAPIIELSSGRPFNIITNVDTNNDQSTQTDRPNVAPDGTLVLPPPFSIGNLGRNRGITHSYASVDLRLTRVIRFGERMNVELIGEVFNLFNRFNEASASPFFQDVNAFGQRGPGGRYYSRPTAAFDPRQFQLGAKFNF
ncbi:MAG TPA: TonB-dependent receptor [Pyrinomonadaceae bacterium]|nr:TonB-dependent receptor [Pyrinomonadaceae bacterium]